MENIDNSLQCKKIYQMNTLNTQLINEYKKNIRYIEHYMYYLDSSLGEEEPILKAGMGEPPVPGEALAPALTGEDLALALRGEALEPALTGDALD